MKTQLLNAFNAAIFAEIIVLFLTLYTPIFNTQHLVEWYKKFKLGAVLQDVLILVIGIILTDYFYPKVFKSFSVIKYVGLTLLIIIRRLVYFSQTCGRDQSEFFSFRLCRPDTLRQIAQVLFLQILL